MNTKQLRQKILDLAIKGKLVPQDLNDEPASKLLERIREEKEQLIKEGKLKRDKNESFIFVVDDKLHYEKFANGSVVCIEDEIPFEIPENWAWCRLGEIIELISGQDLMPSQYNDEERGILYITGASCIENEKIKKNRWTEYPKSISIKNDILISCKGSIGTIAINTEDKVHIARQIMAIRTICNCNNLFIKIFIQKIIPAIQKMSKGVIPGIERKNILNYLIPLPPQSEQVRISSTVQELLEIVETLENDKIDLSELIKQTKAKVLDLAIKGKLVPQNPEDEPADILLEKIREEKENLIKECKLKRDKNETFIFKNSDDNSYYEQIDGETVCIDDNLPFEIPDTWRWCRLSNICSYIQRGKSPKYSEIKKYPVISQKCVRWTGLDLQPAKYITEDSLQKYENIRFLCDNDILWNSTGTGTVGRAAIYNKKLNLFFLAVADSHVTVIRPMNVLSSYIHNFIMSPHVQVGFEDLCDGSTNQKELSLTTVSDFLIPLPPYKEQLRITEKTNGIFSYLDNLETIIKGS